MEHNVNNLVIGQIVLTDVQETKIVQTVRAKIAERIKADNLELVNPDTAFSNARFICPEELFLTEEDANSYLTEHDTLETVSKNIYMPFYDVSDVPVTKTETTLRERLSSLYEKHKTYAESHSVATFKANIIGCSTCSSRINKVYIKNDRCPLCDTNLQSETTQRILAGYEENIQHVQKQIDKSVRNRCQKGSKNYLVHYSVEVQPIKNESPEENNGEE